MTREVRRKRRSLNLLLFLLFLLFASICLERLRRISEYIKKKNVCGILNRHVQFLFICLCIKKTAKTFRLTFIVSYSSFKNVILVPMNSVLGEICSGKILFCAFALLKYYALRKKKHRQNIQIRKDMLINRLEMVDIIS